MSRLYSCAAFLLVLVPASAWAEDEGLGRKVFSAELVRIADAAPAAQATDPLVRGSVAVHRKFGAIVALRGASASVAYEVVFCPYVQQQTCDAVGTLETDAEGNALNRFEMASSTPALAGVFVLSRGGAAQFASGFHFTEPNSSGTELTLHGRIESVGTDRLKLERVDLTILVDANTKFEGAENFAAIQTGMMVEVKAHTQADGTIVATEIALKGPSKPKKEGSEDQDKEEKEKP